MALGTAAGSGRVPSYTIAGLFESGTLGLEAEAVFEELHSVSRGFKLMINPSRGWMSPRYGDSRPAVPRQLGDARRWRRYCGWRRRWRALVLPPCPAYPWGLSGSGLVVALVTSPLTFAEAAGMLGWSELALVEWFVRVVDDYGRRPMFERFRFSLPRRKRRRRPKFDRRGQSRDRAGRGAPTNRVEPPVAAVVL
jgi:hypothetical protein